MSDSTNPSSSLPEKLFEEIGMFIVYLTNHKWDIQAQKPQKMDVLHHRTIGAWLYTFGFALFQDTPFVLHVTYYWKSK